MAGSAEPVELHLSTPVPGGTERQWVIELRRLTSEGTVPLSTACAGERLELDGGGTVTLLEPYRPAAHAPRRGVRLWVADLDLPGGVLGYAAERGSPIRYGYVPDRWPLELLPDHLRHGTGERRDAVGGSRVHAGGRRAARARRGAGRTAGAAHRRVQPRDR